jgi:hypothetical protein
MNEKAEKARIRDVAMMSENKRLGETIKNEKQGREKSLTRLDVLKQQTSQDNLDWDEKQKERNRKLKY